MRSKPKGGGRAMSMTAMRGEPNTDRLARYFYLDDTDREFVTAERWDRMRLWFTVQLDTVRFVRPVPDELARAAAGVAADLAPQPGIGNRNCVAVCREGRGRGRHGREICRLSRMHRPVHALSSGATIVRLVVDRHRARAASNDRVRSSAGTKCGLRCRARGSMRRKRDQPMASLAPWSG